MINQKKAGLPDSKQRELPRVVTGTDLMTVLRQSIERAKETARKQAAAGAPKGKKAPKRNAGQREMLLPIAGGAQKETAEKQPQRTAPRKKAG